MQSLYWKHACIGTFVASACSVACWTALAQETPPAEQPVIRAPGSSNDEVRVSHILLATQEEAAAVQKEIAGAGGDRKAFAAAARKHSKDVTTKVLGGSLDWFSQGSGMAQPFTEASYATKVGDMTGPVKTQFGWHLLLVTDRRDRTSKAPTDVPPPGTVAAPPPPAATPQPPPHDHDHDHDHDQEKKAQAGPNDLAPQAAAVTPKPIPVEGKRRNLAEQAFRLTVESARAGASTQQFTLTPDAAAEINLVLKNESSKEQKFFVRELLPLGLKLTAVGETAPLTGDFTSMAEPASYFSSMKTYEIQGLEVSVNDYFKGLTARRYGVNWDWSTFLANLEARFPKVKEAPDYAAFSDRAKRFPLTVDFVHRDLSPRIMFQRGKDMPVTFAEALKPDKKYFAQIRFTGADAPVLIALDTKNQFLGVRHFASLAQEGFYDGLDFFEVEEGDYLLGGCPTRTGTGAPSMNLPLIRNENKVTHKRGTVALVSRSIRKGPVRGGQVGSIFVVCLKPHAEWDEDHVPIGEVTSGLETLEKAGRRPPFRDITILPEDQVGAQVASTTPPAPAALGNPEAIIKTTKGTITVELFEDVARNTVASFVTLADKDKFYNKGAKDGEKQKLFGMMKDQAGKPLLIQAGSPSSDGEGGPGYSIANELNAKRCVKGALVMAVQYDEATQKYMPDTAGSQFFLCLQDIPYYDYLKAFTVFGQVKEGLDVLDKLADGDTLESIEITKKKSHPYAVRKVAAP
jgi:cyclophilin family peptidyl-prolyl cis-trans isomerase